MKTPDTPTPDTPTPDTPTPVRFYDDEEQAIYPASEVDTVVDYLRTGGEDIGEKQIDRVQAYLGFVAHVGPEGMVAKNWDSADQPVDDDDVFQAIQDDLMRTDWSNGRVLREYVEAGYTEATAATIVKMIEDRQPGIKPEYDVTREYGVIKSLIKDGQAATIFESLVNSGNKYLPHDVLEELFAGALDSERADLVAKLCKCLASLRSGLLLGKQRGCYRQMTLI